MFQTDGSLQPSLFAFTHRDLVKEDSDVWQMRYENMNPAMEHIKSELRALRKDLEKANAQEPSELSEQLSDSIKKREDRIALIKRAKEQIEKEFDASKMKPAQQEERKPRASKKLHDPEALSLGSGSKFPFGYNAQAAVDSESQIVVAAELSDNANDSRSLPTMLDKIAENCGAYPEKTLAGNQIQRVCTLSDPSR